MKRRFALSILATVIAFTFSLSAEAQGDFYNWQQFANWCRSTGGNPVPNPPRCIPIPRQSPQTSDQKLPDPQHVPHLMWNKEKGVWQPERGYEFVNSSDDNDFRVRQIPHLTWNKEQEYWQPEDGYEFVNSSDDDDLRVRQIPHLTWDEERKVWRPEPGYEFVNPSDDDDFRVTRIPAPVPTPAPIPTLAPAPPSDSGPSTPGRAAGTYCAILCDASGDASNECSRSLSAATDALTDTMAEEAVENVSRKMLSVHFPSVLDRAEQIKLLLGLEDRAIYLVQVRMNADIKRLGVFSTREPSFFEVQAEIAQDAILLNKIHQEAVEQANRGMNWDHDWKTDTHTFRSNAYEQARQISFSGSFP
jgi:hypothetical protein